MRRLLLICGLAVGVGTTCAQSEPDKGKELLERVCSGCHTAEASVAERHSRTEWESIVDDMVARGATVSPEEMKRLIDFLVSAFGKPEPAKN